MKPKTNKPKQRTAGKETAWKPALFSFGITLCIGVALVLLASLGAYFTSDPNRLIRPLAIVCAALTFLAGGYLAAKRRPDAPLAAGTANGLLLAAISLALSLLFRKTAAGYPAWASALLHAAMILFALLGAYLFVLRSKSKRARPRKRKRKHA